MFQSDSSQHTDQGAGHNGGAPPRHWDIGNPTSAACIYVPPLASVSFNKKQTRFSTCLTYQQNSQLNSMVGQGLTSTTNVHSGVSGNAHLHNSGVNPGIDAPVPSEFLGTLSRRLILDLGNPVKAFKVEPNESGRLKVTITLETADIV